MEMPRKWRGKQGEENRECDGRTAIRKEREEKGERKENNSKR